MDLFGFRLDTSPTDPARLDAANRAMFERMRLDTSPVGSVGAPGGANPAEQMRSQYDPLGNALTGYALASAPIPGLGDVLGLAADARMYQTDPESRTMANFGQTALGALPWVPPAVATAGALGYLMNRGGQVSDMARAMPGQRGSIGAVESTAYRGGEPGNTGEFYSRDADYAKGFDRGEFGSHNIRAQNALKFDDVPLSRDDVAPLLATMRAEGDERAAGMLQQIVDEDGGVMAADLYQILSVNGAASPEYYFKRAGIDAIDTGRDIRVLNPRAVQ